MKTVHKRIFRGRVRQAGRKYLALPLLQISDIVMFLLHAIHAPLWDGFVVWQIQEASMGSHFAPALCGLVAAFQEILFPPSLSRHGYATKTSRQQQICWTIVSFYFFQAGDNYRRGICSPDLISTYTSWRSWWLWNSWMPDIYKSAKHHSTLTIRSCVFFTLYHGVRRSQTTIWENISDTCSIRIGQANLI